MTTLIWPDLVPDDRMTYMVGLVVRSAVELDAMTREAFASLRGDDPLVSAQAPLQFGPRIQAMMKLVPSAPLTRFQAQHTEAALVAARDSYQERNRFIHDSIMKASADEWFMSRFDKKSGADRMPMKAVTLNDLSECDNNLNRAAWRMWGLHKALQANKTAELPTKQTNWDMLLSNSFSLHPGNSVSYNH